MTGGTPPAPPTARPRRSDEEVGGSTGLRVGTGVAAAVVALLAFKIGTVTSVVLCLLVVTFAVGEAFAVLRRAGWRPATLLGLVGTVSLMLGAYNKGVAALPLVLVLIVAFTLLGTSSASSGARPWPGPPRRCWWSAGWAAEQGHVI